MSACTSQMETGLERKKRRRWLRAPKPVVMSLEKNWVWDRGFLPILQGGPTAALWPMMPNSPVSVRLLLLSQITQIFGDTLGSPRLLGGVEGNLLRGLCLESLSY